MKNKPVSKRTKLAESTGIATAYREPYRDMSVRKAERLPESHGDLADQAGEEIEDALQNQIDWIRRQAHSKYPQQTRYI